jgi:hypothetical protein
MAPTPYFAPLAGFSPALASLGLEAAGLQGSFVTEIPNPGIMSISGNTDSFGGGGGGGSRAIVRIQEGVLQGVTKPAMLLVTMMPDDSGSINSCGNAPAIRRGHNEYLEGFSQSPASILVRTRYLNGSQLFDFCKPKDAVRMDRANYNPDHGTPLYDQTFAVLGEVLSSAALFAKQHQECEIFTMTCILTDGADQGSRSKGPADVKAVVDRMLASGRHIVAGIGVRDGMTNFTQIFQSMGIPEQWIMVLEREEGDIVQGMSQVSYTTRGIVDAGTFMGTSRTGFTQQGMRPASPTGGASRARPSEALRNFVRQTVAGIDPNDPFKPRVPDATVMSEASAVGNMMGATFKRGSAEVGGVLPQNLPWEPTSLAYTINEGGALDAVPTPMQWNAAMGFYTLSLPSDDTVYLFGRDGGQLQEEIRQRILRALRRMREKNRSLRLVYVPLRDKRGSSPISRLHAMIGSLGSKTHTISTLDNHVTIITSDDPSQDRYLEGKKGESTFVDSGNLIKLAPHVVFRVI